jgi:CRP-like cAMP-binding protein
MLLSSGSARIAKRRGPMELLQLFSGFGLHDQAGLLADAALEKSYPKGANVVSEGEGAHVLNFLMKGVADACRHVTSGAVQTVAIWVPGDVLDAKCYALDLSTVSIRATTAIQVAELPRRRLDQITNAHPAITSWLLRVVSSDAAMLEQWAIGLGRLSAYERLAHLLCETSVRMQATDLLREGVYDFPLTQGHLADVLGLSVVHVNRILQRLRNDGLIELRAGRLRIKDPQGLIKVANFDPAYLALRGAPRSV